MRTKVDPPPCVLLILLLISADLRVIRTRINTGDSVYRKGTLKTRDIPTLTNPHLPLNNNGCNPPLSASPLDSSIYGRGYQPWLFDGVFYGVDRRE